MKTLFADAAQSLVPALALLVFVTSPAMASPTLVGSSVTINGLYPSASTIETTTTVTVGSGAEVTCGSSPLCFGFGGTLLANETIDIDALSISGSLTRGFAQADFDGYEFLGLNFGSGYELTGFLFTSSVGGFDASDVSFTPNSLRINLQGAGSGGNFRIDLQPTSNNVPEPSTLALGALALR